MFSIDRKNKKRTFHKYSKLHRNYEVRGYEYLTGTFAIDEENKNEKM